MVRAAIALSIFLACCSRGTSGELHHAGELSLEPYTFRTFDGSAHAAELGKLWVRENRGSSSDRLIEIAFIRIKSSAQKPRSPVVFLPGGPGIPATGMGRVPVYYQLFEKLQAISDVVLVDQRGIGMSSPNTGCPAGSPPAPDAFATESGFRGALIARARACADYWRAKGVELASYSTAASADDLEDLRRALGAEKLSLIAHSYGTSLALETVRRHGEHLERVVLAGVEGPDRSLQMPIVPDFALRRLSNWAATSPKLHGVFPDTYREFQKLLAQADREPLTVSIQNQGAKADVDVKVGAFFLRFAVKEMLPNGRKAGRIPGFVYALTRGDTSPLREMVQDLYGGLTSGFSAMQFAVSCSDGWSLARRELAVEQASHSVFGDAPFVHLDAGLCDSIKVPIGNNDSLLPIWSPVRILVVNGTLDSNTPDFQAGETLWGLPNGGSVLVENGFHETLPAPEVQAVVAEFFSGADVRNRSIKFAPPEFLSIEEAKSSQQPSR